MAEADRINPTIGVNSGAGRVGFAAVAALLVYGGWALWVNNQYSLAAGWRAGLVQGAYAFVLTLCSSFLYEFLFQRLKNWRFRKVTCVAVGVAVQFVTSYGIHWQVGTPAILPTILPGLLIGSVYAASYVILLNARFYQVYE